ncbi:RNA polymerase sigma-70 factor [Parachryseolinea silvisoli]|jgi:RNA polymerase sigma-70 factor (ECF subfamily)|uniref:RNA polymerase sigma-70 factor n=1 Tax=Parachryseolinea silvisoli TaxID=2873601 RepID=UPI002265E2F7|nr:RNA polymerase sigma-70 factor [Parachryseolinea silvisoli]MCD9014807.1 RNA polymerase sigma-70 factor [Parachryseolinea silvisoli]
MSPASEYSDLVRSIKNGDARSLELIFTRLYPRLCGYAQKFLQNIDDAEEVVQDIFYAVWKNRERLDEQQSFKAYLFTAVRNRCLNLLETRRSQSRQAELLWFLYKQDTGTAPNAYHTLLTQDLERDLNAALEQLPKECKKVFELSRFEGLKYREIAQRLNISIKTVETQMSRALGRLRLELREHITLLILLGLLP